MEREANYVMVGVIFAVLLFGAFVFAVWLANFQFRQQYDDYRILFVGPVSGLGMGGEVQFNGIKVGEITRIELDERDPNLVVTDVRLRAGTPVRIDSTAVPVSQGITGVKYVQITPGSPALPLLREASHDHPPVITARRGEMEDLVENLGRIADGGAEALSRINRLLADDNIGSISQSISNVQSITGALNSHRTMFAKMDSALGKIDGAAGELQATIASAHAGLGGKDTGAIAEISAAATELRGAATDLRGLIRQLNGPVSELSSTTLPEATAALVSIQRAAARLDSLANDIQENPGAMLTTRPPQEVEIPQ